MSISGKTAIVTGASAGIGRAIALSLSGSGATVFAVGRRADRLAALADEAKGSIVPVVLDVADLKACEDILGQHFGGNAPDILVNNAGVLKGEGPFHQFSPADWDAMIDTNIRGVLNVTHTVLPGMVAKNAGHIVMVGSTNGNRPLAGSHVYGATKAFVHLFAYNLRAELVGTRLRVSCVQPGWTETEIMDARWPGDEARAKAVWSEIEPLHAVDVATTVEFVLGLPEHVNVNSLEVTPVCQGYEPFRRVAAQPAGAAQAAD